MMLILRLWQTTFLAFPSDTKATMKKTFDLSKELCTAGWNTYAAMALPGSQLI